MVWSCFSWYTVGNLAHGEGIMNVQSFIDIINEYLVESVVKMGLTVWLNIPSRQLRFHLNNIELLEAPPLSPDLNSIENLWTVLKKNVQVMNRGAGNSFLQH